MRLAWIGCASLIACGAEPAPAPVLVPPVVASSAPAPPPPPPVPPPPAPKAWDVEHAPRVALQSAPANAAAPRPIGDKAAKDAKLVEVKRAPDKAPLARAKLFVVPYDSLRFNEINWARPVYRPAGAPAGIPLGWSGKALRSIYETGTKILLTYGPSHLAIVSGDGIVEQMLDLDPPELPLTEEDRSEGDLGQSTYRDGVVYVCRGYNAPVRTRKGYVAAVDVTTGALRWRSPAQTCGGIVALVGDYLLTGYGEDVMPYQLKLLRRYDGAVVHSIRNDGAALDILVQGTEAVVETYKHRITYELR